MATILFSRLFSPPAARTRTQTRRCQPLNLATPREVTAAAATDAGVGSAGTQFTCFTITKVQILTPEEQGWSLLDAEIERVQSPQALPRDALLEIEILPPDLYPADAIKNNIKKTPPRGKGEGEEGGGLGGLVDEDDESVAILLRGDALQLSKCRLIFVFYYLFFFGAHACACVHACMHAIINKSACKATAMSQHPPPLPLQQCVCMRCIHIRTACIHIRYSNKSAPSSTASASACIHIRLES